MCRYLLQVVEGVSIHTPTQGVTFRTSSFNHFATVSIHTPTQGVTSINFIGNKLTTVSIHTPTQGVTTVLLCLLFSIPGFNPHTHAGCDIQGLCLYTVEV